MSEVKVGALVLEKAKKETCLPDVKRQVKDRRQHKHFMEEIPRTLTRGRLHLCRAGELTSQAARYCKGKS